VGNGRIIHMVVAMRYKGRVCVIVILFVSFINVYVCLEYFCVFHLLAHPICLCLAMIMYAVHVSR